MSTKVYTAYRIAKGHDLWDVVHNIRTRAEHEVTLALNGIGEKLLDRARNSSDFRTELLGTNKTLDMFCVFWYMAEQYRVQSHLRKRNLFDFDVSVSFHKRGRMYYVIPYCDMQLRHVLDFLQEHDALDEYGYWDNADKPDTITDQEWRRRAKVWNDIIPNWRDQLILEIVSPASFYLFNFALNI